MDRLLSQLDAIKDGSALNELPEARLGHCVKCQRDNIEVRPFGAGFHISFVMSAAEKMAARTLKNWKESLNGINTSFRTKSRFCITIRED